MSLPGLTTGGTLNMFSAARDVLAYPVMAPAWMDLNLGRGYCIVIANQTGADIDSGEINLQGAVADPTNLCMPGPFRDLDPVADCGPIVTGIPWDPPVRIPITADNPIRAHGVCMFAVPCPLQFIQVTGVPAGTTAIGIITNLRRTNFDHFGPYGGVVPPMSLMNPLSAAGQLPAPQQAQQPPPQPQERRARVQPPLQPAARGQPQPARR